MSLTKQTAAITFSQGIDARTDPKQVVAGKLLTLENGVFTSKGRIQKRAGYTSLSQGIIGGATTISTGQGVATYDNELLVFDPTTVYSYEKTNNAWVTKGSLSSVNVTQSAVIRNTYQQTAQDSAIHASGVAAYAWEDTQGGVRYTVIDTSTGQQLVTNQVVDAAATRPKVLAIGNYILIFYVNGTNLYYRAISVATPMTLAVAVLITTTLSSSYYDAQVNGQRCFIAYSTTSPATSITYLYLTSTLVASTPTSVNVGNTASLMSVCADSVSQRVVIAYYLVTALKFLVLDYNLATTVQGITAIETISNVANVTALAVPGNTSTFTFFYTIAPGTPSNNYVKKTTVTGYVAGSPSVVLRSVGLAGKPFFYANTIYLPLAFQSTLQSTYFIADANGNIVAKALPSLGGGQPARPQLAQVNQTGTTSFQIALLGKDLLTTVGGNIFTQTGVYSTTFNFYDAQKSYIEAELGDNLHVSGGFVQMYDGVSPVEHGFHLYPEGVTTALTDADAGTTQSYQYIVCYEWLDAQGQVHRSAPSPAVTQQKASLIDGTHRVTVTIPTLRLTAKQSRSPVQCVVYRTIANGLVFYQTSIITSPVYNDLTVDTVAFTDSTTDATLIGNPQLYTTGAVVENIAAPPCSAMTIHGNRVFLIDSTNPLTLWYSKQVIPGAPVEFSDLFTLAIDPRGGDVTALATLDGRLVVFKRDLIFAVLGDGPDATGGTASGRFEDAQLITSDCGCLNPKSVVLTPDGLMFHSAKGIRLLDRSLQVQRIGLEVDASVASSSIMSATLMRNSEQVRFTLSNATALVFDYLVGQWSIFTNINTVDAVNFGGFFTYLRPDGQVRQETPGVYSDAGSPIRLKLRTSWLQFAGIQGFQRIYALQVLGEYISPHSLIASIAYDFSSVPTQVVSIDTSTILGASQYGADGIYGAGATYGGQYPLYSWRIATNQQKSMAIQITLEDAETVIGEGLSLSAISVEMGLKQGLKTLDQTHSVG